MKLNNCLYCCCHIDIRKNKECENGKHQFNISEKLKKKFDFSISYIKSEHADDRHFSACLGSAGFIYLEDIKMLANYSYSIGDKDFYNSILEYVPRILNYETNPRS